MTNDNISPFFFLSLSLFLFLPYFSIFGEISESSQDQDQDPKALEHGCQ